MDFTNNTRPTGSIDEREEWVWTFQDFKKSETFKKLPQVEKHKLMIMERSLRALFMEVERQVENYAAPLKTVVEAEDFFWVWNVIDGWRPAAGDLSDPSDLQRYGYAPTEDEFDDLDEDDAEEDIF